MTGRNSWVPSIFLGGLLFVAFCRGDALWGFQRAEAPDVGIRGKCMAWQAHQADQCQCFA
jgi:hypothetical protein